MDIDLLKYNRHWEKGFTYPYPKRRKAFGALLSYLKKRQIIQLSGLRRTGKSVLIFQLIDHLKKEGTAPFNILYFTFDEIQPSIESLLRSYSVQTGIDYKKEKIFLFLDEIQKLKNFQNQIKVFYDLYPNLKFFVLGSTSLFIAKAAQESLAGRIFSYFLKPLEFSEYLFFKEKQEILKRPAVFKEELEKEFAIFLQSQFIESIFFKNSLERKEYFLSIIKKIIYEDLPSVFKFENPHIVFKIAQFIAQKPGALINNFNLSQEFQISHKTVSLYLSYLESAFLVKKLYSFSRNIVSREKRLKKYYLASPSFSFSLVDFAQIADLFENYLVSVSDVSYFYRDPYGHEVDFVLLGKKAEIIPFEAKYKEKIEKGDLKNLWLFMGKYGLNKGGVFYKGIEEKNLKFADKTVALIPYHRLLELQKIDDQNDH